MQYIFSESIRFRVKSPLVDINKYFKKHYFENKSKWIEQNEKLLKQNIQLHHLRGVTIYKVKCHNSYFTYV